VIAPNVRASADTNAGIIPEKYLWSSQGSHHDGNVESFLTKSAEGEASPWKNKPPESLPVAYVSLRQTLRNPNAIATSRNLDRTQSTSSVLRCKNRTITSF
jgi:hypothetical protein